MKLQRLFGALCAGLMLIALPVRAAEQSSYVAPTAGPMSMATFAGTYLNPALRAIAACHNGTSAPANGPSSAPLAYQCWVDTTANPSLYKIYDGASWIALGSINTTSHIWLPSGVATNLTGTAAGLTAGNVTTNANLTGPITSVGNATSIASQTGTGTKFVVDTSPTLVTPAIGVATATSINKVAITAPATGSTLAIPDGVTLTGPASSGTAMTLGNAETVTGVKTFGSAGAVGRLKVAGTTSGTTTIDATAVAGTTVLTLPAATDTLVGKATTDTLTNKTFDTAGIGNSLSINSVAVTANTGTGAVARETSPTFVTPTLGVAAATSINKVAITAPATAATLTIPDGVTLTGPASSGTAMTLGNAETVTGAKSFNDATVILKGSTSGTTTLKSGATAGTSVITLPVATDTLVGKATTDTLTNKTFDTAGTGNSFSINGLAATANTGTGSVVRDTSPTLTSPIVGTQSPGDNTTKAASTAFVAAAVTAATTGVSSIAGNTGAFTLGAGLINSVNELKVNPAYLRGYLDGFTLANGTDATNDIDIADGVAADSTNAVLIAGTAMTKQLDAGWAAGSAAGMRNSGAAITDTTYHIYAVSKAAGADPDYYAHTSTTVATVITALQAETGGSAYVYARRIGSIIRASGAIRLFWQNGDTFQLKTAATDRNSGSAVAWGLLTLTVPTGIMLQPMVTVLTVQGTAGDSFASIGDARDTGNTSPVGMGEVRAAGETSYNYLSGSIFTDTSARVNFSLVISSGTVSLGVVQTRGWIDTRGRLL